MRRIIVTIALASLFIGVGMAQDIITVAELSKSMRNPKFVIVDATKPTNYSKTHIMGAVNLYHKDLCSDSPYKYALLPSAEIAKKLGDKGITNEKTIVVYDEGSGKYSGRLYWILKYMGAKDVKVLDGQIKAWKAKRKPITRNPSPVKKGTFTPAVNKAFLANIDEVKSGNAIIVDVRPLEEYNGSKTTDPAAKAGHIKGAINLDFAQVLNPQGKLKPANELEKVFSDNGVTNDKQVILYCTSGVRAGIVFMALHSGLNYPKVKVYDGAMFEWSQKNASAIVK